MTMLSKLAFFYSATNSGVFPSKDGGPKSSYNFKDTGKWTTGD